MTADEIAHCIHELRNFYDAAIARQWMQTPHKLLGGRMPLDCPVADVERLIDQLKSGAFL